MSGMTRKPMFLKVVAGTFCFLITLGGAGHFLGLTHLDISEQDMRTDPNLVGSGRRTAPRREGGGDHSRLAVAWEGGSDGNYWAGIDGLDGHVEWGNREQEVLFAPLRIWIDTPMGSRGVPPPHGVQMFTKDHNGRNEYARWLETSDDDLFTWAERARGRTLLSAGCFDRGYSWKETRPSYSSLFTQALLDAFVSSPKTEIELKRIEPIELKRIEPIELKRIEPIELKRIEPIRIEVKCCNNCVSIEAPTASIRRYVIDAVTFDHGIDSSAGGKGGPYGFYQHEEDNGRCRALAQCRSWVDPGGSLEGPGYDAWADLMVWSKISIGAQWGSWWLRGPPQGVQEDGYLTAREILGLNFNADLVGLSACETARGEIRTEGGILGLAWAVLVAVEPSSVLSNNQARSPPPVDPPPKHRCSHSSQKWGGLSGGILFISLSAFNCAVGKPEEFRSPPDCACEIRRQSPPPQGTWRPRDRLLVLEKCEQGVTKVLRNNWDPADRDDLAMEAWERVCSQPRDKIRNLAAYAYRTGYNKALEWLRNQPVLQYFPPEIYQRSYHRSVEKVVLARARNCAVRQAVNHLPPVQRKIIRLRFWGEYSVSETAQILGCTRAKVWREQKKAFRQLRRELSEWQDAVCDKGADIT